MKIIKTNRYILRKLEMNDAERVFEILSNENVITNLNMNIHNTIEDTYALFNEYFDGLSKKTKFPYAIIEKNTNEFLGVFLIKLDLYDEDCFEFTIYIDERYWGNGIYTEILPYMIQVVFNDIGTKNFRGFVMKKNKASAKVLERFGFTLEKVFNVPGIDEKILSYLITKEEFKKMMEAKKDEQ